MCLHIISRFLCLAHAKLSFLTIVISSFIIVAVFLVFLLVLLTTCQSCLIILFCVYVCVYLIV